MISYFSVTQTVRSLSSPKLRRCFSVDKIRICIVASVFHLPKYFYFLYQVSFFIAVGSLIKKNNNTTILSIYAQALLEINYTDAAELKISSRVCDLPDDGLTESVLGQTPSILQCIMQWQLPLYLISFLRCFA